MSLSNLHHIKSYLLLSAGAKNSAQRTVDFTKSELLACTATVTRSVRLEVIQCLDMDGCHFVFTSPDQSNMYYELHPGSDIETDMEPFVRS